MKTNGKVALITGANRGIGLETARQLGKEGITVIIGSRDAKQGEAAAAKLRSEKISAESIRLDVANEEDRRAAHKYIEQNHGKLDILINNAGVHFESGTHSPESQVYQVSKTPMETWRKTFDTNFFAPIALTQTLLPLIRKSPAGRIVNLSSILGSLTLHSDPSSPIYDFKAPAYDVSKTALNGFTIHLAYELHDTKIKVNSAHPGWVKTEMGGKEAPMEIVEGAKTSVQLALLPDDGPTGGYFHLGQRLPW
ncbi:MAG TPA: SDR family oxidoreductase [Verrucomicrobiae bacterium]|nr:SDR family oxidoreductase [Verrucomicrobiae bacterium]